MNLILRADVKEITGKTRHMLGDIVGGQPVAIAPLPTPSWIGIARGESGFFLLYFDQYDVIISDTWHETLQHAKRQAKFEFKTTEDDWQVSDKHVSL